MTAPLSDNILTRVGDCLADCVGLHFPPARWRDLQRGIELAAPELGFANALDCANQIAESGLTRDHLNILATYLTISETYFFRDAALFQHLQSVLLPDLIAKRRSEGMRLRLWCAGCCTGEEAYSLAIVLHRLIPDLPQWNISLLATDINVHSLAKAREGCYGPWSFRGNPAWNDSRYFSAGPGKNYTVHPALRAFVRFEHLNLARRDYPSLLNGTTDIDVLLCRNVLMYFEPGAAVEVIGRFSEAIAKDGWLIVAPSELSLVRNNQFTPVHFDTTILHQKAAARPSAPRHESVIPFRPRPIAPPLRCAANVPDAEVSVEKAEALFANNEPSAAWEIAQSLGTSEPRNERALRLLARICANDGRLAEAESWCEEAIAANRIDPTGYYLRALVLQEQGRHADAGDALRQTLYLDPDFIIAHFTLGALAQAIGDSVNAWRHWRNAARLLSRCGPEVILPESGGLSAARLQEIVGTLLEGESVS